MWDDAQEWTPHGGPEVEAVRSTLDARFFAARPVRDVRLLEEEHPKTRAVYSHYVRSAPTPQAAPARALDVTEAAIRDYRRAERSWRGKKGGWS